MHRLTNRPQSDGYFGWRVGMSVFPGLCNPVALQEVCRPPWLPWGAHEIGARQLLQRLSGYKSWFGIEHRLPGSVRVLDWSNHACARHRARLGRSDHPTKILAANQELADILQQLLGPKPELAEKTPESTLVIFNWNSRNGFSQW
jgi:hypothetical protein